jgi:ribonucleoside-triphosphate reductase
MPLTLELATRRTYRRIATVAVVAALVLAGVLLLLVPASSSLVAYGLYAIPSHMLVSFLANEPMLLATARTSPPMLVAIAGAVGCLVAIAIDYAIIGWLVNHRLVRSELDDTRSFQVAQRFFGRAPFLLIVAGALLPVPFFPVKILAIVRDYSIAMTAGAIVLGRLPRFYALALLGEKVQAPDSALMSAMGMLAIVGAWGLWRAYKRNRNTHPRASG